MKPKNPFVGEWAKGARNRVNRGGSFNNTARNARSANRNNNAPTIHNNNLGLRPSKVTQRQIAAVEPEPTRRTDRRAVPVIPRLTSRAGAFRPNIAGRPGVVGPRAQQD